MKRNAFLFCTVLLSAAIVSGCGIEKKEQAAGGYSVVDAAGNTVTIPKKPRRIICDSQSLDTMTLAIVPADHLAAVSHASKDPAISYIAEEVAGIKMEIPLAAGISTEELTAANPDLLICSNYSRPENVELYRRMGFPVLIVKGPTKVSEVEDAVRLIAAALGEKERGERTVAEMETRFAKLEETLSKISAPRPTALLISQMTRYGGPGSMYHELLTRAHIDNAMAKMGIANGQLMSLETMVESDPDFLFVSKNRSSDETGAGKFRDGVLENPAIQSMRAYRRVIPLDDKYIYASTQNCVYAAAAMANAAYGNVFETGEERNIRGY